MSENGESEKIYDDSGTETIVTPGGPRPRSKVHRVGPGSVVAGDGESSIVVTAAPHKLAAADLARAQGLVLTPGGFRHPSPVHWLKAGEAVTRAGGKLQKLNLSTGVAVEP